MIDLEYEMTFAERMEGPLGPTTVTGRCIVQPIGRPGRRGLLPGVVRTSSQEKSQLWHRVVATSPPLPAWFAERKV